MKKEKIAQILGDINEKYVDEAAAVPAPVRRAASERRPRRFRWSAAAACAVFLVFVGAAAIAVAAEAEEYRTAAAFFEENGLSSEGLRRSEIKAVYRDISEKRFSYEKTAEVICRSVPGWELPQDTPAPEDLAALWNKNVRMNTVPSEGIGFRLDYRYVHDPQKGFSVLEKSVLECYRDGKMIWGAEFADLYAEGYAHTEAGTAVWGQNSVSSSSDITYAWIALVNGEGSVEWLERLDHGFRHEYVASMLRTGDGAWAVISRGDLKDLCFSRRSAEGGEISFRKTEVGNLGVRSAARLGDGYLVHLEDPASRDTALIYRLDPEGRVTDSFSYEAENCEYHIVDMTEFEKQVYLSAYAVPIQNDEGGRYEIGNLLDYILSKEGAEISGEELTPLVRDNYTAVLLVCDPNGGSPKTFWSVKGALGGKLAVNDSGQLEWNVESIASTFFSPETSSFTIGGVCRVFCCVFGAGGTLIGQADTGETVPYRR